MPEFTVLIYANDSLHAPTATKEELKECDEHFESLGGIVAPASDNPQQVTICRNPSLPFVA
ncbi:MAG: hypothetical protein J0I04_13110 [Paenarthrobacter ureafaciens]|uniref:hypothetical protein n=1 Tax=Paenarthrobacter ureafaciens TaxID=37931 RepID=UPI001AD36AC6|nr:hypothetical protein [Paenarthrobacter ureafaciens]MBN9130568.1 hypothetical protein [Paenarthrobacter ureafaciens]